MIKHTMQDGQTVDLFTTRDVMEILRVASDETVRRRAKQCGVKGLKLKGVTAYTEQMVNTMTRYERATYKPQLLTDDTPDDLTLTAYEAAHMCGIPTMSFVRRAYTLGIKSDDKKRFTIAQVRDYLTRYEGYVAQQRALPHSGIAALTTMEPTRGAMSNEVLYVETTLKGARYLQRPDVGVAYDWSASVR